MATRILADRSAHRKLWRAPESLLSRSGAAFCVQRQGKISMRNRNLVGLRFIAILGSVSAETFTISTVAGNGTAGFAGDGGPATSGQFNNPAGVSVAPDGSIYVADYRGRRIRKVAPDGTLSTV